MNFNTVYKPEQSIPAARHVMKQGRDYLIFPLDVSSEPDARQLVHMLHDHVGMFKIGLELFIRSGPDLVRWVGAQARGGVFLDLKLHDIPVTVRRAMQAVADLPVALATVHCGENAAMLEAAVNGGAGKVGVLGVTVLTSVGASDLRAAGYADAMSRDVGRLVLHKAAMAKAAGCTGVVCSGWEVKAIKSSLGKDFMTVTPGIRPDWGDETQDDQKRVMTPAMAVLGGADYLVIGRPIRDAVDPAAAADRIAAEIDAALRA
jgi:orotidine-5'-phosphate decarboxylase